MANLRFGKGFVQNQGSTFYAGVAAAATSSVIFLNVLPHTVCVKYYRDFVRQYKKGFEVPVPDHLVKRFEKTLDLLRIEEQERWRFQPFLCSSFDLFSMGTQGRFGVHIGIPANFAYKTPSDVIESKIQVNQLSVIWDTEEGKQLLKSLLMPENGQIYAMAREIKMRDSYKLCFDTFYAVWACMSTYLSSSFLNKRLNLHSKSRQTRFVGYALLAAFHFGFYLTCKDMTQNYYEDKIDTELKSLSPVFAEGGKQFYSQILERNKALRVLMGKEGEHTYTALGNENFLIRNKRLPLVQRKAFFEDETSDKNELIG